MIRLHFTRNASISSKFIRFFTWSDYSHVEFLLDDGTCLGSMPDGGVQIRPLDYDDNSECVIRQIDCDQETTDRILAWAHSQIGKPYDWSGLIGVGIHRDWHKPDAWFCSEFVYVGLEEGDIHYINEPEDRVTPGMIYEWEIVKPWPTSTGTSPA